MGKGDDFERGMCRYLSLWWTDQKDPDVFWRNPTRHTRKGLGKHQLGDIKADKAIGEPFIETFNVEMKSGYSIGKNRSKFKNVPWDLLEVVDYQEKADDLSKKVILSFWKQCEEDAKLSERRPLLIFKRDYHVPVVCLKDSTLSKIEEYNGTFCKAHLSFMREKKEEDILVFIRKDTFFEWLSPESVKVMYND